jgi:hypothetical protein
MGVLDKALNGFGQRSVELHAAQGQDLVEVHDALVKLNANQQTLAGSMDQWRLDNSNELGGLTARMEQIERAGQRPVQLLETLQANVQGLQRAHMKRDEQRSRFRTWLMGTDDWYSASWEQSEPKPMVRAPAPVGGGGAGNGKSGVAALSRAGAPPRPR